LYNELRRKIIKDNPDKFEKSSKETVDKYDGIKYIIDYVPVIGSCSGINETNESNQINSKMKEEIKRISY
jgi:hypothetical protein